MYYPLYPCVTRAGERERCDYVILRKLNTDQTLALKPLADRVKMTQGSRGRPDNYGYRISLYTAHVRLRRSTFINSRNFP